MNGESPQRCILLTGATGFLGTQIVRRLLNEPNLTIITLVRAENQAAAAHRLSRSWWEWPELIAALAPDSASANGKGGSVASAGSGNAAGMRIEIISGDVSLPHLGLGEATFSRIAGRITYIIHAAADLRVNAPVRELRRTNFHGTANMLELARLAMHHHKLKRYAHVSTAYVAGRRSGVISESDLSGE